MVARGWEGVCSGGREGGKEGGRYGYKRRYGYPCGDGILLCLDYGSGYMNIHM